MFSCFIASSRSVTQVPVPQAPLGHPVLWVLLEPRSPRPRWWRSLGAWCRVRIDHFIKQNTGWPFCVNRKCSIETNNGFLYSSVIVDLEFLSESVKMFSNPNKLFLYMWLIGETLQNAYQYDWFSLSLSHCGAQKSCDVYMAFLVCLMSKLFSLFITESANRRSRRIADQVY